MNQVTSLRADSPLLRKYPLAGRWVVGGWLLLAGCHGAPATESAPAPGGLPAKLVPTVLRVTRHFADELAQGTQFRAADAPRYADSLLHFSATSHFYLSLPGCLVESTLMPDKTLDFVFVWMPFRPPGSHPALDRSRPNPDRLLRLGELRRAFGPGKIDSTPVLTKETFTRSYPVTFRYQPTPESRPVLLSAAMPTAAYADSAWVNSISLNGL
ncbi:hypothetical protein QMK33_10395 [Hymenobacter sp. H14-R3]|uniref:hypothetical protein n=1 Tax=Hymenobacter sp. H14-R3 TaxID=3046308 RepID=UPI0024BAA75F|nr:hypothetical protein [Hymenobacter sp. H14-R3]MDJ0365565.1 hypothetical protein [Hymenobacter sp. H14-R3]